MSHHLLLLQQLQLQQLLLLSGVELRLLLLVWVGVSEHPLLLLEQCLLLHGHEVLWLLHTRISRRGLSHYERANLLLLRLLGHQRVLLLLSQQQLLVEQLLVLLVVLVHVQLGAHVLLAVGQTQRTCGGRVREVSRY